jgi:lysophospholipase L1-like esterase
MKFRTELEPQPSSLQVSHQTRVLALGSCFAERIGARLAAGKFPACVNPAGIYFQPPALRELLALALEERLPPLHYSGAEGCWFSYALHSRLNQPSREAYEAGARAALGALREALCRADLLILTLGSAVVHRLGEGGPPVANCQRQPSRLFRRELLPFEEALDALRNLIGLARQARPGLPILLSVSPVRHTRDGLPLNAASKATLRLACQQLLDEAGGIHYFPAYELLLDDLRDYRFYAADLVHPSEQAEEYIWEHFARSHFSAETRALLADWEAVRRDLAHRPRHPGGPAWQQFLAQLEARLQALAPRLDVEAELAALRQQQAGSS